jgi:hypothetical protein
MSTAWTDFYQALFHHAANLRGAVVYDIDDDATEQWPLITGADATALMAFFDHYMRDHLSTWRPWHLCADNIVQHLLTTSPDAEHQDSPTLWRCLAQCAALLDAAQLEPPAQEHIQALFDFIAPRRNAGPAGKAPFVTSAGFGSFDDLYTAQFLALRDARGADKTADNKNVPRTTNGDVIALVNYWSPQLARVKVVMGRRTADERWKAARSRVDQVARTGAANARYPFNPEFWRTLQHVAIHIAVADEAPTKWDMALDALHTSTMQLPETLGAVVNGAGQAVSKIGTGILAIFKTPLLLGGGAIGLYLLARSRNTSAAKRSS